MTTRPRSGRLIQISCALSLATSLGLPAPVLAASVSSLAGPAEAEGAKALYQRASAKYSAADYESAIDLFTAALEKATTEDLSYRVRGALLFNLAKSHVKAYEEITRDIKNLRSAKAIYTRYLDEADEAQGEYGDTADRIQITAPVGALYLIGAAETSAENFVNQGDDLKTFTGGIAYLGERFGVGSYNTYRVQTFEDNSEFKIFTADLWAKAELGMTEVEFEFAFQTGSGNLSQDVNDVRISGIGTQLTALLGNDKMRVGASSGLATGDQDPVDNQFRSFSFDPDFNVALMMFEEPMPVLNHENPNLSSNGGREWGAARLGEGISNALYVRPAFQYTVMEGLDLEFAWIGAKAAKLPESESDNGGYGSEFDFTVDYRPFDHFRLTSTTGYFMPGKYISSFEHEELGGGFTQNAIGSRLVGTVNF